MLKEWLGKLKGLLGKRSSGGAKGSGRQWILPGIATFIILLSLFSGGSGAVEVEPGEVAVIYNQTGISAFGDLASVSQEQGVLTFFPGFQRVEKLDVQPQIFVMEGNGDSAEARPNQSGKLTVRAKDGSNFYFERVEIHYQLITEKAAEVIVLNGPGDDYKGKAIKTHAREILRDEFGRYEFLEIANPATYGEATSRAKRALNERLNPLGIEVTNIPPPKPRFDTNIEQAIEKRQNAEQEVEVQREERNKLKQERERKLQQVAQRKSAEFQGIKARLEAELKQAQNTELASKREADKYFIERDAEGKAMRDEKVTQAKANEVAYRREAEGLAAKIRAVGEEGPDVLNRVIAEKVFPQMRNLTARPYTRQSTPIDIRHIDSSGEQ
ncbi:MAG: SPFH domain-containing protein [Bradymonadia bacterium]